MKKSTKKILIFLAVGVLATALTATIIVLYLFLSKNDFKPDYSPPSNSPLGTYSKAGVSSDGAYCAQIAKDILEEGGSVADASIGALLCMGVINCQSMGIGGGFLLVMYNATTEESIVLNARETAPGAAYEDMFQGKPELATKGGLAVAVPGEIKGYWELHKKSGRLPWARLFEPTIKLCIDGFNVTFSTAAALLSAKEGILKEPSLSDIFINPKTGDVYKVNELMKRPILGQTLREIADRGGDDLYNGELADRLIADLQNFSSIITREDLENYNVTWSEPIVTKVQGNYLAHSVPPPGSGILVAFMLSVLSDYLPTPKNQEEHVRNYQRIIETFKYTYAKRSILGDPSDDEIREEVERIVKQLKDENYAKKIRAQLLDSSTNNTSEYYGAEFYTPDDHGTSHFSIIGPNGDAISATSTINLYFGAGIRSPSTGIILNNEMDDFSSPNITNYFGVPPSVNNFIKPGKRPMSSMCPTIFTQNGKVMLAIGAAGGTRITTSTAFASINNLFFNMNVKEALDERRMHHQLFPMAINYENGFSDNLIESLKGFGHYVNKSSSLSVVGAVARNKLGEITANYDFRKAGSIAGY